MEELVTSYGALAGVIGLVLREAYNSYKNDKREKAADSGLSDLVEGLFKRLEQSDARADEANRRADEIAKERNGLYQTLGRLEGEVAGMRSELRAARMEIAQLRGVAYVPTEQN
ncbi:hypothetical protein [Schauerella aestuarii]|uniref:hypothetical protein n=1 Tax=Schauerella aestuarii TaxID=2511204 RepID=UPI00137118C1|nr:hypothetical protein [Achromobacter aestuarii]MDQ2139597.1 hypothetical protein [Alcaligenaceae bacterium B3P038]MYZ41434.1 hypothetical protein [Achromobacter aestuarii]